MKRRKVREIMQQNPFWCCVPLVTVTTTLKLLRDAGFDHSHICAALPIILYPKYDILVIYIYKNVCLYFISVIFCWKDLPQFFQSYLYFQEKVYSSLKVYF